MRVFRQFQGEVRRICIPRTPVNNGKRKYGSLTSRCPGPMGQDRRRADRCHNRGSIRKRSLRCLGRGNAKAALHEDMREERGHYREGAGACSMGEGTRPS
jgi:hypothetical protein